MSTPDHLCIARKYWWALVILSLGFPTAVLGKDCECVAYVKHRIQFSGSLTGCASCSAKDAGPRLLASGYQVVQSPEAGDIVVFQPAHRFLDGSAFNPRHGHVAFVESASLDEAGGIWEIVLRGANQPGEMLPPEHACDNVTLLRNLRYRAAADTVVYYRTRAKSPR